MKWWINREGEPPKGPYNWQELATLSGFYEDTLVSREGDKNWVEAAEDPELESLFESPMEGAKLRSQLRLRNADVQEETREPDAQFDEPTSLPSNPVQPSDSNHSDADPDPGDEKRPSPETMDDAASRDRDDEPPEGPVPESTTANGEHAPGEPEGTSPPTSPDEPDSNDSSDAESPDEPPATPDGPVPSGEPVQERAESTGDPANPSSRTPGETPDENGRGPRPMDEPSGTPSVPGSSSPTPASPSNPDGPEFDPSVVVPPSPAETVAAGAKTTDAARSPSPSPEETANAGAAAPDPPPQTTSESPDSRGEDPADSEPPVDADASSSQTGDPPVEGSPEEDPSGALGAPPDRQPERTVAAPSPAVCAGFWTRSMAFLTDGLLLGLLGFVLGMVGFAFTAGLGPLGRLVGFLGSLAYFGAGNSWVGRGQTPGKYLFGLRVRSREGEFLSLSRSLLRYTVLAIPFFLLNLPLDGAATTDFFLLPLPTVHVLAVYGLGGALLYVYLVNRRSRRSLHDYLANSVVVETSLGGSSGDLFPSLPRTHRWVLGSWVAVLFTGATLFPLYTAQFPVLTATEELETSLMRGGNYHSVRAGPPLSEYPALIRAGGPVSRVEVDVWFRSDPGDLEERIRDLGRRILRDVPALRRGKSLVIQGHYGFDLGISRYFRTRSVRIPADPARASKLSPGARERF